MDNHEKEKEPLIEQSRAGEAGANLTDVLERKLPAPMRYFGHSTLSPMYTKDEMIAFARESINAEREACVMICDDIARNGKGGAPTCVRALRERSNEQK